jgi:hypothetical protein
MSDTHELEGRFWSKFGPLLFGQARKPATADEWIAAGRQLKGAIDLEALAARLETAANKPVAAAQRPQARRNTAQDGDVYFNGDGVACCPTHERPLKEGRYGFYCPAKDPNGKNGYCDFRAKGI